MDILVYMLWILTGFGPSAIAAYIGIRALLLHENDMRANYTDVSRILDWLMPALAVTAVGIKFGSVKPDEGAAISSCFFMLFVYFAVRFIMDILIMSRSKQPDKAALKDVISNTFWSQGKPVGILACVMIYGPAHYNGNSLAPSIYLFAAFYISGYWGEIIGNMLRQNYSEVKVITPRPLEPGELHNRIDEIASSMGLNLTRISVIDDKDSPLTNAAAINLHNNSQVIFTESLIKNLSKDEVDAVVAHEIGHCVDANCWELSGLYKFGILLVFLAAMAAAERWIGTLSPSLQFLQYVKWLSLFVLPPLAVKWYSRQREHEADANYGILANPQACVSGLYKLHLLSEIPISRPVWSQLASTHPSLEHRIKQIASQYNVTESELKQIFENAMVDLEHPSSERYELTSFVEMTLDEKPEKPDVINWDIDPFPNLYVRIASMIGGIFQLIAFLILAMLMHNKATPYIIAFSVVLMLVMVVGPHILYAVRYKRIQSDLIKQLIDKLNTKYGEMTGKSSVLVKVMPNGRKYWQSAWLVIGEKRLQVLGEVDELDINVNKDFTLDFQSDHEEINKFILAVHYISDSGQKSAFLDILTAAKKDNHSPKSVFQLKKLIENDMPVTKIISRVPPKQLLTRIPIALLIFVLSLYLVSLIIKLSGLDQIENLKSAPYVWAVIIIGGLLSSWVFRKPKSESTDADSNQTASNDHLSKNVKPYMS